MIPGTVKKISGKDYLVPPLNIAAMISHEAFLKKVTTGEVDPATAMEQFVPITELVHLALKRNYPEITLPEVQDMLDFGNIQDVFEALVKTSGFVERVPEPGEA